MRLGLARLAIGIVAVFATVLLAAAPFVPLTYVDLGLTFNSTGGTAVLPPAVVALDGIAAKAGIRSGERLRLDPDTADERIRFRTLGAGERVDFVDRDTGKRFELYAPAEERVPVGAVLAQSAIFLSYAIIALVLVRRRSRDGRAVYLAGFLAAFAAGSALGDLLPHARSYWWTLTGIAAQSAYVLGGAFVTLFAATFPRPFERGFRALVRRLVPAITVTGLAVTVGGIGGQYLWPQIGFGPVSVQLLVLCWTFYIAGSLGSLLLTLRESRGLERQQMLWIAMTFGAGFSGLAVMFAALLFARDFASFQLAAITVALIPFGLAYVILRHRVVDVGFALNRAAVFGAVSLVVVGMFVALEWFISKYLLTVGHVASSAVELAVALTIGFSLRPVHARIDRVVDDLFFRKRHEAEQRLRRLARELPYFTERAIALQRTCDIVSACADATLVAVFERESGGYRNVGSSGLPFLDDNDAAVVAFKAFHEPVLLDESGSALGEGLAFGLQVREETIGFLVLGPSRGGETYAPDERDALEAVARSLASLLDALEIAELRRQLSRSGLRAPASA